MSAAAWAAFAAVEHRGTDPMLPLRLFARPGFRTGAVVGLLINLGFYGQLFLMSLYFQDVRGYSALRTGLALLPEAARLTVASAVSGRLMARTGPRLPMLAGLLLGGAGLIGLPVPPERRHGMPGFGVASGGQSVAVPNPVNRRVPMSAGAIVAIIVAVVVVLLVIGGLSVARRRKLQQRFGPEYDRVVGETHSHRKAGAELTERERRVRSLDIHPLEETARAKYAREWAAIQVQFVDQPEQAVAQAGLLVTSVMKDRGYPTEDYEQILADLSVEHANTLDHYRAAHQVSLQAEAGRASTEDLRLAMLHYRALFGDLLGKPAGPAASVPADPAGSLPADPAGSLPDPAGGLPDPAGSLPDATADSQPAAPRTGPAS